MNGKQFKDLRTQAGMSQTALAHASGVANTQISDVERGVKHATLAMMRALEKAMVRKPGEFTRYVVDRELVKFLRTRPRLVATIREEMEAASADFSEP